MKLIFENEIEILRMVFFLVFNTFNSPGTIVPSGDFGCLNRCSLNTGWSGRSGNERCRILSTVLWLSFLKISKKLFLAKIFFRAKNLFWAKNFFFGIHFLLFSDSRDLVIHYHKLRKLKFANHFINHQWLPFKERIVPGRPHSELCAWGVKLL